MNILVTGASRGIGKTIAKSLQSYGNVYVTARNEEKLKEFGATFNPRLNGGPGWIIPNNKESSFRHTFAMYI